MTEDVIRREDVTGQRNVRRPCVVCGREITLYFNGGELDEWTCCGHVYRLVSPATYFEVVKP